MNRLLLLVHRIPYPPNKGDKIRSFNILAHLAERYRVSLAAFVDDPDDWAHAGALGPYCDEVALFPLHPRLGRLRSLAGLATGEALSVRYFRNPRLQRWLDARLAAHGPLPVVAYSSTMAQYVLASRHPVSRFVVDMVDVDSDKWRQYSLRQRWPLTWIYARESERLLAFEKRVARCAEATVFVSAVEADLFRRLDPESAPRVTHIENGVDTAYFSPERDYPNPYPPGGPVLVFTGAMDYWANVDAVTWLATSVLPELWQRHPSARLYIVGSRPAEAVQRLAGDRITVTGTVPDVRPYLAHAAVAVPALRIARGVQNKVLEAMAMARPVVTTPAGMEGIEAPPELRRLVAESPSDIAASIAEVLEQGDRGLGSAGREFVVARHSWESHLARLDALLEARA